jgi:hypothetical protein
VCLHIQTAIMHANRFTCLFKRRKSVGSCCFYSSAYNLELSSDEQRAACSMQLHFWHYLASLVLTTSMRSILYTAYIQFDALNNCCANDAPICTLPLLLLCTHSKEPYILDFVQAALAKGSTVCVMVARGLMATPVVGESLFHGARTSDVEATVAALRSAVGAATPLALVGFSM